MGIKNDKSTRGEEEEEQKSRRGENLNVLFLFLVPEFHTSFHFIRNSKAAKAAVKNDHLLFES